MAERWATDWGAIHTLSHTRNVPDIRFLHWCYGASDGGGKNYFLNGASRGNQRMGMHPASLDTAGETVAHSEPRDTAHVLVVEDDAGTRVLLTRFLSENGLRATGVRDGRDMWDVLDRMPIDLVLLDVMLPGTTGLDLCRALRARSTIGIIMVTARGSELDRVLGLEFGADDYVSKPFSRPELLARIRAVLRRGGTALSGPELRPNRCVFGFGAWRLDTTRRELTSPAGASVDLSGAEYDLLLAFLEHPQRVLSRDQILELSRNRLGNTFDRAVDVLVSRLRRKIDDDHSDQALIKTIRGAGYMFAADVVRL